MFHAEFQIKTGGLLHVRLEGDFTDQPEMQVFKQRILEACGGEVRSRVVLDFERVRMIDSRGIGLLAALHTRSVRTGSQVVIAAPQSYIEKALEITKLDTVMTVVKDKTSVLQLARHPDLGQSADGQALPDCPVAVPAA